MFLPLHYQNRKVAQLVAHYVRDVGVGRSSRLFPTEERGYILYSLFFCAKPHKRNAASFRQKRGCVKTTHLFFVQSLISEMPPLSDRKVKRVELCIFTRDEAAEKHTDAGRVAPISACV